MYQSIIVALSSHHQFVLHRPCKYKLSATGGARRLQAQKEGAR
jgi:hypothetical protein